MYNLYFPVFDIKHFPVVTQMQIEIKKRLTEQVIISCQMIAGYSSPSDRARSRRQWLGDRSVWACHCSADCYIIRSSTQTNVRHSAVTWEQRSTIILCTVWRKKLHDRYPSGIVASDGVDECGWTSRTYNVTSWL